MDAQFHKIKREAFLSQVKDNSLAVFFSGRSPRKSADSFYPFDVDKNFYYLTGIAREEMVLLLTKIRGKTGEILYIPPVKEIAEKWDGIQLRENEARNLSGISDIRDRRDFRTEFMSFLSNVGRPELVYLFFNMAIKDEQLSLEQNAAREIQEHFPHITIENSFDVMVSLRSIKTPEEIAEIQQAISITAYAFQNVLEHIKPGIQEHVIKAYYNDILNHAGVENSFEPISASGKNAVILHYLNLHQLNCSRTMDGGDLLLFDAGAKVNHYCADLTRTYPVSGKYTARQKELYQIVLDCQQFTIDLMRPGETMITINEKVIDFYARELKAVGLIETKEEVQKYFYHPVGHPLGLDVHDLRSRDLILKPGMVYTVEPGIYIAEENLGIRIEDDILVTSTGVEILSTMVSREIADIESVRR